MVRVFLLLVFIAELSLARAASINRDSPMPASLPDCGTIYAPPMVGASNATKPRTCSAKADRNYQPKYDTVGHRVLSSESDACFVPDESFRLLDNLIDQALAKKTIATGGATTRLTREMLLATLTQIGQTLVDNGFALFIPTETLGDALAPRVFAGGATHIADCDTSSLIYLSVAEAMSIDMNLVDIRLPSGAGHNYVRTLDASGSVVDWDTNGRRVCKTPIGLPSWQGKAMTRDETLGYTILIRASLYERQMEFDLALADFQQGVKLYPASPLGHNNLAWLLSTRSRYATKQFSQMAVAEAREAVQIERSANNLDTLACAYAANGQFDLATQTGGVAATLDSSDSAIRQHFQGFQLSPPRDCIEGK